MEVKKDWWKNFFNEVYLITDARSVCDENLTRDEVSFLEDYLALQKKDKILDLCGGQGRHSLELARRGYNDVTVLDYSSFLIKQGQAQAKTKKLPVQFIRGDARNTHLPGQSFSVVIIMSNSFGYSTDPDDNKKMLNEVCRLLQPKGRVLIDVADSTYIRKNLKPQSWHQATDDVIVCRQRTIQDNFIKARELVLSRQKGLLRDGLYCEQLFTKKQIRSLLRAAGFYKIAIKDNISLHRKRKDYGFLTSRMMVSATKK